MRANQPHPKIFAEGMPECETCVRKEDCGIGRLCTLQGICIKGCVNNDDCIKPDPPYCDAILSVCKAWFSTRDCRLDQPGTVCCNDACGACDADDVCVKDYGQATCASKGSANKRNVGNIRIVPKRIKSAETSAFVEPINVNPATRRNRVREWSPVFGRKMCAR